MPASLSVLRAHAQHARRCQEAGGILLGRLIDISSQVLVDEVTVPGPEDRRSRFRFFRAKQPAQVLVDQAWARSGGELNYIGEWHTHPEDHPVPSCHDRSEWRRLATTQRYEQSSLFFVIVGRRSIGAWEFSQTGRVATELPPIDVPSEITRT